MAINKTSSGAIAKRRNHTVPKALLKRWLVEKDGKQGHWVLDCDSGSVSFKSGKEAEFAIRDYCYVPIRSAASGVRYRDESVEDWFSIGESALAKITDLIVTGGGKAKRRDFEKLLTASILLGYRSAYEYALVDQTIRSADPELSEAESGRMTVDHFRSLYATKLDQFREWNFSLFHKFSSPLMICDRPLFDATLHTSDTQLVLIPLTPDLLLVGNPKRPGEVPLNGVACYPATETLGEMANHFTIQRARQFVVGQPDQLLSISFESFSGGKFLERKAQDSIVFTTNGIQILRAKLSDL